MEMLQGLNEIMHMNVNRNTCHTVYTQKKVIISTTVSLLSSLYYLFLHHLGKCSTHSRALSAPILIPATSPA